MILKRCFKCGLEKPRDEFYDHPAMGDGKLGKCKECTKKDVRKFRKENQDKLRDYELKRSRTEKRKASMALRLKKARLEHPDQNRARQLVQRAVRLGYLVRKPCEKCGSESHVHAHHDDYTKPLEVVWLCARCHVDLHRSILH